MLPMPTCQAVNARGLSGSGRALPQTVPSANRNAASSASMTPGPSCGSKDRLSGPRRTTTPHIPKTMDTICRDVGRCLRMGQASRQTQMGIVSASVAACPARSHLSDAVVPPIQKATFSTAPSKR